MIIEGTHDDILVVRRDCGDVDGEKCVRLRLIETDNSIAEGRFTIKQLKEILERLEKE